MEVHVEVTGKKLTRVFTVKVLQDVSHLKRLIKGWCGIEESRQILVDEIEKWKYTDNFMFLTHPRVRGTVDEKELRGVLLKFHLQVTPLPGDGKFTFSAKFPSSVVEKVTMRETQLVRELKQILVSRDTLLRAYEIGIEYLDHIMDDNNASLRDYCICSGCQVQVFMLDD